MMLSTLPMLAGLGVCGFLSITNPNIAVPYYVIGIFWLGGFVGSAYFWSEMGKSEGIYEGEKRVNRELVDKTEALERIAVSPSFAEATKTARAMKQRYPRSAFDISVELGLEKYRAQAPRQQVTRMTIGEEDT